jgi:hypothetical protein
MANDHLAFDGTTNHLVFSPNGATPGHLARNCGGGPPPCCCSAEMTNPYATITFDNGSNVVLTMVRMLPWPEYCGYAGRCIAYNNGIPMPSMITLSCDFPKTDDGACQWVIYLAVYFGYTCASNGVLTFPGVLHEWWWTKTAVSYLGGGWTADARNAAANVFTPPLGCFLAPGLPCFPFNGTPYKGPVVT